MRILHCINTLSSGGAEVFVASLAMAQQQAGHEVSVFTYCGATDAKGAALEQQLQQAGISHASPRIRQNWKKPAVPYLISRYVAEFSPDVIHSHLEHSDFFVWLARKVFGARGCPVRTIHNVYATGTLPAAIHKRLANAFTNVACSQAAFQRYPYLGHRRHLVNNGVTLGHADNVHARADIRANLGIGEDTTLFVSVGSFGLRGGQLQKAQDIIIEAVSLIGKADIAVLFIGDGEMRPSMEALSSSLGSAGRCIFLGKVANVPDYLAASDCSIMPSRFEGLSIACIEAVTAGLPLIVSDIDAFLPFRRTSTLVAEGGSSEHVAECIRVFLDKKAHYRAAALSERSQYRNEFDIRNTADQYLSLYAQCMPRRPGGYREPTVVASPQRSDQDSQST